MPTETLSFTTYYDGLANALKNEVRVSKAFDATRTKAHPEPKAFIAIWDTGATGSVITKRVIDECGLKPISMTKVQTAGGETTTPVFLVNIFLPNKVAFQQIKVTEGTLIGAFSKFLLNTIMHFRW